MLIRPYPDQSQDFPGRIREDGLVSSRPGRGQNYCDLADARTQIGQFIEQVYNRRRLHSALKYRSPEAFEDGLPSVGALAAGGNRSKTGN